MGIGMPISKRGLEVISKHKYSGRDDSILYNYVLVHWINFAIKFVPIWLAYASFIYSIRYLSCLIIPMFHIPYS